MGNKVSKRVARLLHDYVVIDGLDGIGKTTQIALLKNHLETKKTTVLCTRALGGVPDTEIDILRKFLFANTFSCDMEEDLIEVAARLNLKHVKKEIYDFYQKHTMYDKITILQDRGIISHFTYAHSKGVKRKETFERFTKVLKLSNELRVRNIVLVPKNIEMILERIKNRGDHNQFHDKYENYETQKKVYDRILFEVNQRNDREDDLYDYARFDLIEVDEKDQPLDIHYKILKLLE